MRIRKAIRTRAIIFVCSIGISSAFAQVSSPENSVTVDKNLGITTLPLWGGPGASNGGKNGETSFLTVFVPQQGRGNGTAVIVAPGGAYKGLSSNLEGRQVADWFTARGVIAFVLKYRLGQDNPYPAPLLDAQRAVRLVRSVSQTYKFSPDRIGIMGFSAGGHLAAMEATSFDEGKQDSSDPVERLSDRPNFVILGYPWLNAMQPNSKHLITYCSVLSGMPPTECKEWEDKYTPALHVTAKTPSTFIYHTTDDALVPVETSIQFYSALLNAGVPVEMHVFRHGAHGSGLGTGDEALDLWPVLLEMWMRGQGWLTPDPASR